MDSSTVASTYLSKIDASDTYAAKVDVDSKQDIAFEFENKNASMWVGNSMVEGRDVHLSSATCYNKTGIARAVCKLK